MTLKPFEELFSSLNASASARAEISRIPCGSCPLSRAENQLPAVSFELRTRPAFGRVAARGSKRMMRFSRLSLRNCAKVVEVM